MHEINALYQAIHDSLGDRQIGDEFCAEIRQTIQDSVDNFPPDAKVGLRCADRCMKCLLDNIDFSRTNVIGVYDLKLTGGEFAGYPIFGADQLSDAACDYVIFATFTYRNAILEELNSYKGHVIDIYALLSEQGIELRGPLNHYQAGMPLVLNYFYLKFLEAQNSVQKEQELQKFLQAALEYRDFVMIEKVYKEYGGVNGEFPLLIEIWKKVQHLLQMIQTKINRRSQKDIIAFWTDAISYMDLDDMPGMKAKTAEGCFFERTYTSAPWTRPVLQAIFQKLLPIDGFPATQDVINTENSEFLRYLERKNYEFRWVSFPVWAVPHQYTLQQVKKYMSNSLIWWYGLCALLSSEKPCFYIFHFLIEGHHPMLSPNLIELNLSRSDLFAKTAQAVEQRRTSLSYLDQSLTLYNQILDGKDQIFFSDHGNYWADVAAWSEERLRVYCLVLGKSIPKQRITKLFSNRNFMELFKWLIEPERHSLDKALTDEIISQDVDYYGESTINAAIDFFQKGYPKSGIAFRGVITAKCKYVLNALGEEFYYIISETGEETQVPLEDDALRKQLQSKCGRYFIDIRKIDKFKHSRRLYESILCAHPELGKPLWYTEEN